MVGLWDERESAFDSRIAGQHLSSPSRNGDRPMQTVRTLTASGCGPSIDIGLTLLTLTPAALPMSFFHETNGLGRTGMTKCRHAVGRNGPLTRLTGRLLHWPR